MNISRERQQFVEMLTSAMNQRKMDARQLSVFSKVSSNDIELMIKGTYSTNTKVEGIKHALVAQALSLDPGNFMEMAGFGENIIRSVLEDLGDKRYHSEWIKQEEPMSSAGEYSSIDLSSLRGVPIGVIGTGSAELSEAEKAAAKEVGLLLAGFGAQLVCGLEPGVDHAVLRSYIDAAGDTPDRGHRIHLLATDKELRGYTVRNVPVQKTVVTDGDTFIEEFLVRVSVVIVIGGRGSCYRIYQEALRRDIYSIPIPGTGGDTERLGAEVAAAREAQENAINGQPWLAEELKRRTTDASPTRWVAVVGLRGDIGVELEHDCVALGQLLARLRIGLRTGCRTGVDQVVGQSYLDELTRNNQAFDSRRYLVWIGPKDIAKPAGRREFGQSEEEHFDLLLEGVSALFVLNGNKWTLHTVAEAARRGILIISLASTGGAAFSASKRLLRNTNLRERMAKYDRITLPLRSTKEAEMLASLRQIFEEPRYPEVFAPVVDIPEDASLEEVRELLGLSQKAELA